MPVVSDGRRARKSGRPGREGRPPTVSEPRSAERVPPHDVEAEAALLGAMMLDRDVVSQVGDLVHCDDFYLESHRLVYEAISALDGRGTVIDALTVKDELRRQQTFDRVGGAETVVRLLESTPSSAGARHHAEIVRGCSKLRRLIQACQKTLIDCYEYAGDSDEVIDQAEQSVFEVRRQDTAAAVSVGDMLQQTFELIEARRDQAGLQGLDTGFADLNDQLNGLHAGNLVIVAARPSMGKTSFSVNVGVNAALRSGKAALIFSLEVPKEQVVENILCSQAEVDAHAMRKGQLDPDTDWPRLVDAANRLSESTILIDDTPGISSQALRAKARRAAARYDLGLIIVDYMQLMTHPGAESRQHEITMISQSLKTTARQLNVPVVALSQLNRAVDAREDHRPRMSDLRESGSIEQDADVIMFLYREAYYKELPPEAEGKCEIIVAKHRNGPVGTVNLHFRKECLRFYDPARIWNQVHP